MGVTSLFWTHLQAPAKEWILSFQSESLILFSASCKSWSLLERIPEIFPQALYSTSLQHWGGKTGEEQIFVYKDWGMGRPCKDKNRASSILRWSLRSCRSSRDWKNPKRWGAIRREGSLPKVFSPRRGSKFPARTSQVSTACAQVCQASSGFKSLSCQMSGGQATVFQGTLAGSLEMTGRNFENRCIGLPYFGTVTQIFAWARVWSAPRGGSSTPAFPVLVRSAEAKTASMGYWLLTCLATARLTPPMVWKYSGTGPWITLALASQATIQEGSLHIWRLEVSLWIPFIVWSVWCL